MEVKSNKVIFNPCFDKHPVGAVLKSDPITFTVRFPSHFNVWDLSLIIETDEGGIFMEIPFNHSITFQIDKIGIYWYFFRFSDIYGTHYLMSNDNLDAKITDNHEFLWQLNIHDTFPQE